MEAAMLINVDFVNELVIRYINWRVRLEHIIGYCRNN